MQIYNLLPIKDVPSVRNRDFMNEDGEKCINAKYITHNGILYTAMQILDDDDVYSIFEVILLRKTYPKLISKSLFRWRINGFLSFKI